MYSLTSVKVSGFFKISNPTIVMITEVRLEEINIDLKRFQNRNTAHSERSVAIICENYDERLMIVNPITLWKDINGKTWLLAGHSRLQAHRILKKPTIHSVFFEGTEAEAMEYAKNSNNIGSRENYLERLKLYREKYEALGYEGIQDYILKYEDRRSLNFLMELLHLNPEGALMEALTSTIDTGDQTGRNTLESIASMIGRIRIDFADKLSDEHELEMFRWLVVDANFKATNKGKFLQRIKSIVSRESFSKGKPLVLSGKVSKPDAIKRYESEEQALFEKISAMDKGIHEIHLLLIKSITAIERIRAIKQRNDLLDQADDTRLKLSKLRANKNRYEEAAEMEYDMFNPPPETRQPKQTTLKDVVRIEKHPQPPKRKAYTLDGVSTADTNGMIPIANLIAGDRYKRKNKPTFKEWTVLEVNGDTLKVTSGENNFHTVHAEKSLLVYLVKSPSQTEK